MRAGDAPPESKGCKDASNRVRIAAVDAWDTSVTAQETANATEMEREGGIFIGTTSSRRPGKPNKRVTK